MNSAAREVSTVMGISLAITAAMVGLILLCVWLLGFWGGILALVIILAVMWCAFYWMETHL